MKPFIITTLLFAAAACSTVEEPPIDEQLAELGYVISAGNERIPNIRIRGWSEINDRNLIVSAGMQDKYLIELRSNCINLQGAFSVAFSSNNRVARIDKFESLYVRGPGRRVERCNIRNIYRLIAV